MGKAPDRKEQGISIVIPSWNGRGLLDRFLPSVLRAAKACAVPWEVIVCDDESSDHTVEFVRDRYPEVKVFRTGVRKGFPGTGNMGAEKSSYRIVLFLNNDVELSEESLKPLLPHFEEERVFAVLSKCYDWDGKMLRDGGKIGEFRRGFFRVNRNYDVDGCATATSGPYYSFYATGGFSAFSREKLLVLGGFDELFAPFNWEDADLSYRAWKRGWEIRYEPASIVRHRPGTTIRRYSKWYVKAISRRNRLLFVWKNLSDGDKLLQHFAVLFFESLFAFLRFDLIHFASMGMAFSRLPPIARARRRDRTNWRNRDGEILEFLKRCYQRPEIRILD
jgi:GT2 family glycosyltransferase